MRWSWLALVAGLAGADARADDVLLVPVATYEPGAPTARADALVDLVFQVLRDNAFVVINATAVHHAAGDVLEACGASPCVAEALMSVPARVAMVMTVAPGPTTSPGALVLTADFFAEGTAEPVQTLVLPVEPGRERKVALQVALFALDVCEQVGRSSDAAVEAARRLAEPMVEVIVIRDEGAIPEGSWRMEALEDEALDDEPVPIDEQAPPARPATSGPTLDRAVAVVDGGLAPRLVMGVRRPYEARTGTSAAWYRKAAPHAGRFLLQLRGGLSHSDGGRGVVSLLARDGDEVTGAAWEEGPVKGVTPRVEGFVGFAPSAVVDVGVVIGVHIARDVVALGYMRDGQDADLGTPETFTSLRVALQPRVRFFPVVVGPVKPYLVVAGEAEFVPTWRFDVTDAQPFPRPPGGTLGGLGGGVGLSFDPHPRVGIVLEALYLHHLGPLARVRTNGVVVGNAPAPPLGSGFAIVPMAGVEVRL